MSGRWVDTMEIQVLCERLRRTSGDEGCSAATATIQGICMLLQGVSTNVIRDTKLFVADYTQAFLNAEVREGERLYVQPPEGWNRRF